MASKLARQSYFENTNLGLKMQGQADALVPRDVADQKEEFLLVFI
jgi:hypothetical protein